MAACYHLNTPPEAYCHTEEDMQQEGKMQKHKKNCLLHTGIEPLTSRTLSL